MTAVQIIDTHCHLYADEFSGERRDIIRRAISSGVGKMYMPNVDVSSIDGMLELETDFPERCVAMMGLHPCSVKDDFEEQLEIIQDWLAVRKFAAIGEIGLDFHWDLTHSEKQYEAFRRQLTWSLEQQLPVVIHSRESLRQCIDVVSTIGGGRIKGIFHCFGGTIQEAQEIIDLGMFMGIGGVLTFKNSGLQEVIKEIGINRIVLETDAPYLAPVPFRGKRNEPSYLLHIVEKLVGLTGMTTEDIHRITTGNAVDIFQRV